MSRIKQCLSPTECVELVNDMIKDTDHQTNLIEWKKRTNIQKGSDEELGRVGSGWWQRFKAEHSHKITSRKGHKFELDRAKWTTWQNFCQMYRCFAEELEYGGLAQRLEIPQW